MSGAERALGWLGTRRNVGDRLKGNDVASVLARCTSCGWRQMSEVDTAAKAPSPMWQLRDESCNHCGRLGKMVPA